MGTRNLTLVVIDEKYKVAQYCQWDGYPDSQGSCALKFLKEMDKDKFKSKVRALKEINPKDLKSKLVECGADPDSDMVNVDVSDKFKKKYPHLNRDMGAEVLEHILKSKDGLEIQSDINFALDSLFCEWAYVIDLDTNTFEIYTGFNMKKLKKDDRFYFLEKEVKKDDKYHPISLLITYNLDELPEDEDFIKDCEEEEKAKDILKDIKESKIMKIPKRKTYRDSLGVILSDRKNLPLLMGINDQLTEKIEEILKDD